MYLRYESKRNISKNGSDFSTKSRHMHMKSKYIYFSSLKNNRNETSLVSMKASFINATGPILALSSLIQGFLERLVAPR